MFSFFKKKKFHEPLNKAVFTTVFVAKQQSVITHVTHDDDGDWQFFGKEPLEDFEKNGMLVSLKNIIDLDITVLDIADLPAGYRAFRNNKNAKWEIVKIQ